MIFKKILFYFFKIPSNIFFKLRFFHRLYELKSFALTRAVLSVISTASSVSNTVSEENAFNSKYNPIFQVKKLMMHAPVFHKRWTSFVMEAFLIKLTSPPSQKSQIDQGKIIHHSVHFKSNLVSAAC